MRRVGFGLAVVLSLQILWREHGSLEATRRAQVKRLAFVARYGHTGDWMFHVPSDWLQDFAEALSEIVEEENRAKP